MINSRGVGRGVYKGVEVTTAVSGVTHPQGIEEWAWWARVKLVRVHDHPLPNAHGKIRVILSDK
jgi:hypothetical protein